MKQTKDLKIAIVSSSFRKEVADNLEKNCLKTFKDTFEPVVLSEIVKRCCTGPRLER